MWPNLIQLLYLKGNFYSLVPYYCPYNKERMHNRGWVINLNTFNDVTTYLPTVISKCNLKKKPDFSSVYFKFSSGRS